jgi:hypothetical protein
MGERRGEKIGWTLGWLGGFAWVAILSGVFLFQREVAQGVAGILLTSVAAAVILAFAPWRHPSTAYWKLMMAPYAVFFASVAWAVWAYGGLEAAGLNGWFLLWLAPMLIPFGSLCRRRWADFEPR